MKKIFIIAFFSLLAATEPKSLDKFVENHLLMTKSKMAVGPTLWLDVREGYLRNKTIRYANVLLDSLDSGSSPIELATTHFPAIDDLRKEVVSGEGFDYKIERHSNYMKNVNYFSSLND